MIEYEQPTDPKKAFLATASPRALFLLNGLAAIVYFCALAFFFPPGDTFLYTLLIIGEVFHLWQVFTFLYTVWDTSYAAPQDITISPAVDVFITVAGEPVELVEETVRAAKRMRYPRFSIFILNDGYVAKKDNWLEIEMLAERLEVGCITRKQAGGAKAGNINHALTHTRSPLVAIFDADHVPHTDFLAKTVPYFVDETIGFVQTPQYYKNADENYLTKSSWEQQELFFGPIQKGKNRLNAATMCGTNMLLSRTALLAVGGMHMDSIAEDFVTGMFIHERGYRSVYHGEVLAEGLACEDLLSYSKQQFRWARGALDLIFGYNPLFRKGLSWPQRVQYLASASFYLSGIIVLVDLMLPLVFFYTGYVPIHVSGMSLAGIFLPYLFLTLYTIQVSSNFTFTFPSLALSMGSFWIQIQALYAAATGTKSSFSITPKRAQEGNFISLATPHILYVALAAFGLLVALAREGLSASLVNNLAWILLNTAMLLPFIRAARLRTPQTQSTREALVPQPAVSKTYGSI